jgi:hypothetical protein
MEPKGWRNRSGDWFIGNAVRSNPGKKVIETE